jgi:nitroreductase
MDVIDAIMERRSVRRFKPDPIPEEDMDKIIEAVRMAPSWANTQCWELILVYDEAVRKKLSEEIFPGGNPAQKGLVEAPVVLVALGKENIAGAYKGEFTTDKGDWFLYDIGVAMQNVCLAAKGLGLGTVHVGAFDAKKTEEILGVPEGVRVVSLTPLGYPAKEGGAPARKEVGEFVFRDAYGKK